MPWQSKHQKDMMKRKKPTEYFMSEENFKEAVSILINNPEVFDESDKKELIKSWFDERLLEIFDTEAKGLKCGVGSKQGATCRKGTDSECLLLPLCIHKDRKTIEKNATTDSKGVQKERSPKKYKFGIS